MADHWAETGKIFLCIDDNEDLLHCEKEFLESFGYTVLSARSGGKALKLASINPIDVVVGYLLPEMDGQEFADSNETTQAESTNHHLSGAVYIPEQALKSVDAFIAQGPIAQPFIDRNCAVAGMLTYQRLHQYRD